MHITSCSRDKSEWHFFFTFHFSVVQNPLSQDTVVIIWHHHKITSTSTKKSIKTTFLPIQRPGRQIHTIPASWGRKRKKFRFQKGYQEGILPSAWRWGWTSSKAMTIIYQRVGMKRLSCSIPSAWREGRASRKRPMVRQRGVRGGDMITREGFVSAT